ncbi:MAG: LA_2272 family surface repeat-containing protein [Kiritimatiellia bacterium]
MKIKSGLFACALAAAFAVQPVLAQDAEKEYAGAPDAKSYGYTVLAVGLATPLTLPWGFDWDVFGLDVNLLYSDCNKMYGLEVGGLANTARLDMYGIQAALGFNLANRTAVGAMVSCFNMCNRTAYGMSVDLVGVNREFEGLSVDGLFSMTDESFYGLDVAGLANAVREDMWGWQVALGATFARRVHGLQTSLIFNMTDELRGAQVGIVNYADTCSAGFQIGIVNLIMDNQVKFFPIFNCYF